MNKKAKTIWIIILFVLFIIVVYFAYNSLTKKYSNNLSNDIENSAETQLQKAPNFTVLDNEGNEVQLSSFLGKPVVLNFWASWCPPCKSEMPHFNEVYEDRKDEIVFMMVDLVDGQRETVKKGQEFIKENGYGFPVYFDTTNEAASFYSVSSIPMTFFINKEGYVIRGYEGAISKETLINSMEQFIQ